MAVYLNDHFLRDEDALLHVSDLSMQRGYALFDFLRSVNGIPLFIDDHLKRLYASAAALHLPVKQQHGEFVHIIHELLSVSALPDAGIRIMLTGGYSSNSYTPSEPNLLITCNPVKTASEADFENGTRVLLYQHQRELPHIKSINYQMAVWLQPLLAAKNAGDVLYHQHGIITEFPRSNVFIITREGKLVTPASNILEGVTRRNLLALAGGEMEVEIRDIELPELLSSPEVFMTSTTKRLLPVVKIDDTIIGDGKPGQVTRKLYSLFLQMENREIARHRPTQA